MSLRAGAAAWLVAVAAGPSLALATVPRLEPVQPWRAVVGGSRFHLDVVSPVGCGGGSLVVWSLAVGRRAVSRGEHACDGASPTFAVDVEVPATRSDVDLTAELSVAVVGVDGAVLAAWTDELHLLAADPFAGRRQWLAEQAIGLFDPHGETRELFQAMAIPCAKESGPVARFAGRLLVVGAGLDLDRHPTVWGEATALARRGTAVLVLAPASGHLAFPADGEHPEVRLASRAVITRIHPLLDRAWPPDGHAVRSSLLLEPRGAALVASVVEAGRGWPWLELDYPGGGRLVVCGFALTDSTERGPSPRHLLAQIIEALLRGLPITGGSP